MTSNTDIVAIRETIPKTRLPALGDRRRANLILSRKLLSAPLAPLFLVCLAVLFAAGCVTESHAPDHPKKIVDAAKVISNQNKVHETILKHLPEIDQCYAQGLAKDPTAQGKIVMQWSIGPKGKVYAAQMKLSTINSPQIEACTLARLRSWKFPDPVSNEWQVVNYPFVMRR